MGIVNVTPDSFSDGGVIADPRGAAGHAVRLVEEGAAIVDVGGESVRPGAQPVGVDEELRRVIPALERIIPACPGIAISIDTTKADVAERALGMGAAIVNDVSALRVDPRMAAVIADSGATVCLMHMQGVPETMQVEPRYDDVVSEVQAFLHDRIELAVEAGIDEERICVDPGIGFGKTVEHNCQLLAGVGRIADLGRPVVVGASRKSFLGRILGDPTASRGPLSAALAVTIMAYERGAAIFRVHDVREHVQALRAASSIAAARQ
jgi:dihydropteroate synthase